MSKNRHKLNTFVTFFHLTPAVKKKERKKRSFRAFFRENMDKGFIYISSLAENSHETIKLLSMR